jgi:alkanesulfonate monooxygenase SsuD/methylene tetrahydromethanopterin reductase-like flavin-dependent oxidoreductase (luciferase family)
VGGGGARRTPRLAARFADELNLPFASVAATARQFARVRAACEAAGRDPARIRVTCAPTRWSGTPGEVVARLRAVADAGASRT